MLVLQGSDDGQAPASISLNGKLTKIGRDPKRCDFVFTSNAVSGYHAVIEKKGTSWILDDQNSTNGCYVNEVKIKAPTKIQDGDIVCFGAPEYGYKFSENKADGPGVGAPAKKPSSAAPGRRGSFDDKPKAAKAAPGVVPKAMPAGNLVCILSL